MNFKPVRVTQSQLGSMPVVNGQLIFAYDTGNIYMDTASGRVQQIITVVSDSSSAADMNKLYFVKNGRKLLYNGKGMESVLDKHIVNSDAQAQVNGWYLCEQNAVVTLPAVHADKDVVKISAVLDADNVLVSPYGSDTIQSQSGLLLDVKNSSVQLMWDTDKWVMAELSLPGDTPLMIVDEVPAVGKDSLYYQQKSNKLKYWDGAWINVADFQERVQALQEKTYKAQYDIKLGKCTALGVVFGSDSLQLTWKDPDDVELETAVLAEWEETRLLKKKGDWPSTVSDSAAELVFTTSRELGNKNSKFSNPVHQAASDSTYYKLFSKTVAGAWNNLDANKYPVSQAMSWGMVQHFVRAGRGPELWPVGTVFEVEHPEYYDTNGHSLLFRVVGHDQVPAADESLTHTMCLDMVDVLFKASYDHSEYIYALTEDTTAQAGKTYYSESNGEYSVLTEGVDYEIGDPVPAASWYEKNPNERESANNNPIQSNLIQWANSSGAANQWFTKQSLWDTCSSDLAAKNGFCRFLDAEFLSVVKPAKLISNVRNNGVVYRGVEHNAKFWSLSITQITGDTEGGIHENSWLSFYSEGGSLLKKELSSGLGLGWWIRSIIPTSSHAIFFVPSDGVFANWRDRSYVNTNQYGYSLACIIA